MAKRLVDIVLSAVLLMFFSPVLVFAAVMIRLTSRGPALFRQLRMGRGFQPFEILKLRTMESGRSGSPYTLGPDPRITPVGRLLRETKIDELPQLWNVLRGEMSLVGPRPVVPEISREFRAEYQQLLRVRPGLTDPASIKYRQETRLLARVPESDGYFKRVVTPDKIRISAEYVERANFWTDGMLLAMTAAVCCFPFLSRIYGQLPEWTDAEPRQSGERPSANPAVAATDDAIFSHSLAYLEAVAEQVSHPSIRPPIPLLQPQSGGKSTSHALH